MAKSEPRAISGKLLPDIFEIFHNFSIVTGIKKGKIVELAIGEYLIRNGADAMMAREKRKGKR